MACSDAPAPIMSFFCLESPSLKGLREVLRNWGVRVWVFFSMACLDAPAIVSFFCPNHHPEKAGVLRVRARFGVRVA